jgi:hypothetical protein
MKLSSLDIDRLLGRVPDRKRDLLLLHYHAHGQRWIICWESGDNLGALQAAVSWMANAALDFNLADAVRVNERITTETCRGK